jgi:FMN phosphatase YigB (HAD superfamily)
MNIENREIKQTFPNIKNVIFDWKRTLYDPDSKTLIDGAMEVLETLSNRNIPMFLIGKGDDDMYGEVTRLNVGKFFKEVKFVKGEKNPEYYKPHIDTLNPGDTVIIGDRVRSELSAGKSLSTTTIWVRQGRFADELPENKLEIPDFQVGSLTELKNLIQPHN